ncbi:MAG TPA: hypothetical protein VGJ14_17825 [Sporichthyaceae bacterium]|jgi:cell division septum initiation protein DivIVA
MTSPRPTDLNFALPPGFVPAVRPVPAVESTAPVAEPKPRAPRKPRAATTKAAAPKTTTAKPTAPKTTTRPRTTPAVKEIVEHEAGRILEDAARTAADMLAAARSTAARLGAELAAEHEQRRREMEDAVADLADYLDELAHRLRTRAALAVE